MGIAMDYENWENYMLNKGYPKPFLKNIAVGSVVTLQSSLVKMTKCATPNEILDENRELKYNAEKYGLAKLNNLSDTLSDEIHKDGELKSIIKEMALHLKEYKEMVKNNCAD